MTNIYTSLDSLANDLRNVPCINNGGCGITALELFKRMPTELQPRILVGGVVESNCRELAANLRNGTHRNSVGHAFLGLTIHGRDYVFDPSGLRLDNGVLVPSFGWMARTEGALSPGWLAYMVNDPYRWNPWFDRCHVPAIKAIARKHLGPVKRRVRLPVSVNNGQARWT